MQKNVFYFRGAESHKIFLNFGELNERTTCFLISRMHILCPWRIASIKCFFYQILAKDASSSKFFRVRQELSDRLRVMYNTACKARTCW